MKTNYYFLHGFLGDASFFSQKMAELKEQPNTGEIHGLNLFSHDIDEKLSPKNDFVTWANHFNAMVLNRGSDNNVLVAYSMGGRLGVHAFMQQPSLWQQCYFLSTNPGIIKSSQKMVRMAWEDGWCHQIDNKPWVEFVNLWNQQDLFKHCEPHKPSEQNYNKNYLKLALKNWSLTKHKIDLKKINDNKLSWFVGEKDTKYNMIHQQMAQNYQVEQITTLEAKGHRINSF